MNEIQLIRDQLAAERQHASAVANVCASALGRADVIALTSGSPLEQFRQACVDYLVCVLAWFEERDQRLSDLWHARFAPGDAARRALEEVLAHRGRSREALEKLEAAFACTSAPSSGDRAHQSWQEFAQFFNSAWSARRDAIEALLALSLRTSDWRLLGGIDADSILEERNRYARVRATLPAGASLAIPPPREP
ncbi:MAG TPA: hypothetical protein VGD47_10655 [Steroidobacteraceae bacterium]